MKIGDVVDRLLGLPAAASSDVTVMRNLRVPMSDGVRLAADVYRPRRAGPLPAVLVRTPYGKHRMDARVMAGVLARRGLQVVVGDARGVFGSGGRFHAFHQEKDDGRDTAAWVRAQPWCDGRLASAGPSYPGYMQWALGAHADPPLEAMCLGVTASQFVSSFYPGGVPGLDNLLTWAAALETQELPWRPLRDRRVRRAMTSLPLLEADVAATGRRSRFFREVVRHAEPGDRFWEPTDHSLPALRMETPTSMVTGWYDLFLRPQLADFTALRKAGRISRITIGPWAHDLSAIRACILDAASWLGAHLLGDGAQNHRAPVRLYLQHAGTWLDLPSWPPPGVTYRTLRLGPGLGESARPCAGPARFVYDPAGPTPTAGGPMLTGGRRQQDNLLIERRPDVLVHTGPALTRDLDVVGPVTATVDVRTSSGHGDVFVRLCDVDRSGVSRNVTDGIVRLRPGDSAPDRDGVVRAEVELDPTAYRFRRGHRLRVQVSGGAFPRFARNHGTGEPAAEAVAVKRIGYEVFPTSALALPLLG
ncbi:CocE/NonD family hydrolase [Nonomuraea typhae]|uniref:CocE/NonD family hydrolase n=1 Tax=Nonomuraea typhae TaxID=2603600 RepID=A0ABW7Z544_9ACTN